MTTRAWAACCLMLLMLAAIIFSERPVGPFVARVLDDHGHPLAGATVTLEGPVRRVLRTGDDGRCRGERLPVGSYDIHVGGRGRVGRWVSPPAVISEDGTFVLPDVALEPRAPEVALATPQQVFAAEHPVLLAARAVAVSRLDFALNRLEGSRRVPLGQWSRPFVEQAGDADGWGIRSVRIPGLLPSGRYVLTLTAQALPGMAPPPRPLEDRHAFIVTRLALVAKRDTHQLLVMATDMVTGQPMAGIQLRAGPVRDGTGRRRPEAPLNLGVTNAAGLWRGPVRGTGTLVVTGGLANEQAEAIVPAAYAEPGQLRALTWTDRPLYRPGHEIHWKTTIRAQAEPDRRHWAVPGGLSLVAALESPSGRKVEVNPVTLDDWGAADGTLRLPAEAEPGYWQVRLVRPERPDETVDSQMVRVAAYRKPEARVVLTPPAARQVGPGPLVMQLEARDMTGGLLADVPFAWRAWSQGKEPPVADDMPAWFQGLSSGWDQGMSRGMLRGEGEGRTDEAGRAMLRLPADGPFEDETWTFEAEIVDPSRMTAKGTGHVDRVQGDVAIAVRTPGVLRVGQPWAVDVDLLSWDKADTGQARDGELVVERVTWVRRGTETREVRSVVQSLPLSLQGRTGLHLDLQPQEQPGDLEVRVTLRDAAGRTIRASGWAWSVGGDALGNTRAADGPIEVRLRDRMVLPGATTSVLIRLPDARLTPLVTVEGRDIHEVRRLPAGRLEHEVILEARPEWAPDVAVKVTGVLGTVGREDMAFLNLMPQGAGLRLDVMPTREDVLPGADAEVSVRCTDEAGKPTMADVALAVVDEAVLDLEPDKTPDPRPVFFGPRWDAVQTALSFAESFTAGPPKELLPPETRSRFEDTAAWLPKVRTDANGQARVRFRMPEDLTTWRLTALGMTRAAAGGVGRARVRTLKPLVARLGLPAFLVSGDKIEVLGSLFETRGQPGTVTPWWQGNGLRVSGGARLPLALREGKPALVPLALEATASGPAEVAFGGRGNGLADGLRRPLPVLDALPIAMRVQKTRLAPDKPWQWHPTTPGERLEAIAVGMPQTRPWLNLAATALAREPYACGEQLSGALYGRLLTGDKNGARDLLALLTARQHPDGGWGWFPDDESDPEVTALVLGAMADAQASGLPVDGAVVRTGCNWLATSGRGQGPLWQVRGRLVRGAGPDGRALVAATLGRWGLTLPGWRPGEPGLSAEGRARTLLALPAGGRSAQVLLGELARGVQRTGDQAWWRSGMVEGLGASLPVVTTARVLQALRRHAPDHPLVEAARYALWSEAAASERPGWPTTLETAEALRALQDASPEEEEAPASIGLRRDGDRVGVTPTMLTSSRFTPVEAPPGRGVTLIASGSRPVLARLRIASIAAGGYRQTDAPRLSRRVVAVPEQLVKALFGGITGHLYDAPEARPDHDAWGRLAAAERIRLRVPMASEVTVETGHDLRHVVLEEPLPSGAEVWHEADGSVWSGTQILDDRVVVMIQDLPAGRHVFRFYWRALLPGRLVHRGSSIRPFYARGGAASLGPETREVVP
ncbi:MAG: hypothetical protein FJY99_05100 [Candidatus Sericytochromatia bacterium]|nr:hypothetical protein [Candidatus Tanganyikabacteria bacterium]